MFSCDYCKIFLIQLISKNICKKLLINFFNGSLLNGPKGSWPRLYDGVRIQGPSHRSSFLFLSRYLSFWRESKHAFKNLRRIPLICQLSFYIVFLGCFRWFQVVLDGFRSFYVILRSFWVVLDRFRSFLTLVSIFTENKMINQLKIKFYDNTKVSQ